MYAAAVKFGLSTSKPHTVASAWTSTDTSISLGLSYISTAALDTLQRHSIVNHSSATRLRLMCPNQLMPADGPHGVHRLPQTTYGSYRYSQPVFVYKAAVGDELGQFESGGRSKHSALGLHPNPHLTQG